MNQPRRIGDLVQEFLVRAEREAFPPREAPGSGVATPPENAPDPLAQYPDAPTDEEISQSWHETHMPDFDEYDGSCGCGESGCAGAC
jgi:hypothetical protein